MEGFIEDILDIDQIQSEPLDNNEAVLIKGEPESAKVKEKRKKQSKKNQQGRNFKGNYNPLLLSPELKPKLSREERKNLQLLELFEKMEQKEKRKEGNQRKKRKLDSDKSPDLSAIKSDSYENEDFDKQPDNDDGKSLKSDTTSSIEKSPVVKKNVPPKVTSKYFNADFDLGTARNLISYLYDYQKENMKKYSSFSQKLKTSALLPKKLITSIDEPAENKELLLYSKNTQLESLNKTLKEKNDEFLKHLKRFDQIQANKDVRHIFYSFNSK